MARKSKKKSKSRWSSFLADRQLVLARVWQGLVAVCAVVCVVGAAWAVSAANDHASRQLVDRYTPRFVFVDVPDQIWVSAERDLAEAVAPHEQGDWMGDDVCRHVASRVSRLGWVRRVHHVRRQPEGLFEISCDYRTPAAMVEFGTQFYLVDWAGYRLPGTYSYAPQPPLIQGVQAWAPEPGEVWSGADLQAGLAVLAAVRNEPYADQITGVLVDNYDGRQNPTACHIVLATDRAGGRIRWGEAPHVDFGQIYWGSAPGEEVAETFAAEKCAILRANYRKSGRVDDNHPVIDISVRADGYIIPGDS